MKRNIILLSIAILITVIIVVSYGLIIGKPMCNGLAFLVGIISWFIVLITEHCLWIRMNNKRWKKLEEEFEELYEQIKQDLEDK